MTSDENSNSENKKLRKEITDVHVAIAMLLVST